MFLEGIPISRGYASGTAVVYDFEIGKRIEFAQSDLQFSEVEAEWRRLDGAINRSMEDLIGFEGQCSGPASRSETKTMSTARSDLVSQIAEVVKAHVERELVPAEEAIASVVEQWVERLQRHRTEPNCQREIDIRDAGRRMTRNLAGSMPWKNGPLPPGSIIVAREILPTEVLEFAACGVVAMVVERGGEFSHSAILARSLGIPAITRVLHATSRITPGMLLLVDAVAGHVTTDPSNEARELHAGHQAQFEERLLAEKIIEDSIIHIGAEDTVDLFATVTRVEEVDRVVNQHFSGVGLLCTEFLFLNSPTRPTIGEHVEVYTAVAKRLGGLPLTIRTFDFGNSKLPHFLIDDELDESHLLHLRGFRFLLAEWELLEVQLRALLHVAQTYDIRILFPMVTGVDELQVVLDRIDRLAKDHQFKQLPAFGAMIETPAALYNLSYVLDCVDFVMIGTNDLSQYMLATDRDSVGGTAEYSAAHPAVLRALQQIIEMASQHRCPVAVCGEAAGVPEFACLLVGLGVSDLSLAVDSRAQVSRALQSMDRQALVLLAQQALSCRLWSEVQALLTQFRDSLVQDSRR